ncbi:MAG: hypothetical protein IJ713_01350 [Oscillibacter sp.]|nr:hypothetical protein [Oscillibacter sp.]
MAKTKAPSGLTVSRSGTKYTVKWKVNSESSRRTEQKVVYQTRSAAGKVSAWSKAAKVGKSATSYSVDVKSVTSVRFAVASKQNNMSYSAWTQSPWYEIKAPNPPVSLAYENETNASGTFSWAAGKADEHTPLTNYQYQTGYADGTGEAYGAGVTTTGTSLRVTESDVAGVHRRCFRVRAYGPGGYSAWKTIYHIYALPPEAEIMALSAAAATGSSYALTVRWKQGGGTARLEKMRVQYHIGVPTVTDGELKPAAGAGWTDAGTELPMRSDEEYAATVSTDGTVSDEEALFVRIRSVHDGNEAWSPAVRATEFAGELAAPALTIGSIDTAASAVTFESVTNNSAVPGWLEAYAFAQSTGERQSLGRIAASAGETVSATVMRFVYDSAESYSFGVQAVSADGSAMRSAIAWSGTISMAAPTSVTVEKTDVSGTVRVSWAWAAWADGAEIQWSDNPLAWDSNAEPESYAVEKQTTFCYIAGLETDGTVYYFRVALTSGREKDGNRVVGLFSDMLTVALASAPSEPVLWLSRSVTTEDDTVTAGWIYAGTDGTAQATAELCEAEWSSGWEYGEMLASVGAGQSAEISLQEMAELHGWRTGETHFLSVRTTSESGLTSSWSAPVSLTIAEPPAIDLTDPFDTAFDYTDVFGGDGSETDYSLSYAPESIASVTVDGAEVSAYTLDGQVLCFDAAPEDGSVIAVAYTAAGTALTALPLPVRCSGAGADGTTTLRITRRDAYAMERPDGTEKDGWEGETVFAAALTGEAADWPITAEALTGRLDDGAAYTLTAVITDVYGQTDTAEIDFEVHWSHQAWIPTASVSVDAAHMAVAITPLAGEDFAEGDVCDIYRLSADAPELIVQGGTFGTTYYDPYPAFGPNGGHRVVCRTANGDYITERSEPAWLDLGATEGDTLSAETLVIDYAAGRAELPYDLSLENSWDKDFRQTSYLGGSIVGDWNRTVKRSLSASTLLVRNLHESEALDMRTLARSAGVCHVRTPEGSSFCADVQVSESRGYDSGAIAYTLKISAVDPEGFDGMTAEEWASYIGE